MQCFPRRRGLTTDPLFITLHGPVYGAATVGCNGAPPTASSGSVNEAAPSSIHLSLSEIAQRRKDGKCFKCDELFTPGYRQHCKHPLVIEVVDDDEADNSTPTDMDMYPELLFKYGYGGGWIRVSSTPGLTLDTAQ
jgi:hypothetical protein